MPYFILILIATQSFSQSRDSLIKKDTLIKKDSVIKKTETLKRDTVFKHEDIANQGHDTIIHKKDSVYRRALAEFDASLVKITNEAVRAYSSPTTFSGLLEQMNGAYPLILTDQSYGRESFEFTNRTSEPLAASFLEGVLPLNDPITGNTDLNYFPLEIASVTTIENGGVLTSADHGSSDAIDFTLEKFRAPIPYSRFHYTQELSNSFSNFEGLFSISPTEPLNLAASIYRRTGGTNSQDITFNPRVDAWWIRTQATYFTKKFDATLFTLYRSVFSGMNGGIVSRDSLTDIFDEQLATVNDPIPYDHRTRFDILAQAGYSLFSESERTQLSAYATTSSRTLWGRDSTFPSYAHDQTSAQRYGISLLQPGALQIGEFITRATLRGDIQYLTRKTPGAADTSGIAEERLSAMASDSISLSGLFGISASGYLRETISKLSIGSIGQPALVLTNFGLEASAKLTEALKFTAQANYTQDRASLSPTPTVQYSIKNIGAFVNMNVPFGKTNKFSLALGYLDRHEPEGVVLAPVSDSTYLPVFSKTDIHTGSIRANMDVWFSYFRYALYTTFFPTTTPISQYTTNIALQSDLKQRIQSSTGLYYENEIAEGNLRMSFGARVRYMNELVPSLSYDQFSDYYTYRGLPIRADSLHSLLNDSRLTQPKYIFDILVSTIIDQRATVNASFLNILSTPYYNVGIYPRGGFQFRLDVTWAFLD